MTAEAAALRSFTVFTAARDSVVDGQPVRKGQVIALDADRRLLAQRGVRRGGHPAGAGPARRRRPGDLLPRRGPDRGAVDALAAAIAVAGLGHRGGDGARRPALTSTSSSRSSSRWRGDPAPGTARGVEDADLPAGGLDTPIGVPGCRVPATLRRLGRRLGIASGPRPADDLPAPLPRPARRAAHRAAGGGGAGQQATVRATVRPLRSASARTGGGSG